MSIQPAVSLPLTDASRLVWVVNTYNEDYRETWKGREIVVKANGVKELLMPVLEANRFLGRPTVIITQNDLRPDGTYPQVPKALKLIELTDEEKAKLKGKSVEEIKDEEKKEQSLKMCSVCGDSFPTEKGLSLHVRRKHSEVAKVEDET